MRAFATRSFDPVSATALCVATDGVTVRADLYVPARPRAVVIATRSGTKRADEPAALQAPTFTDRGLAMAHVDLLAESELGDARRRLDVFLLARRLEAMTDVVARLPATRALPIAYLCEGTSAAGALVASLGDSRIRAVVCRFGRPDLAEGILDRVTAPILVITDAVGKATNGSVFERLGCHKKLVTMAERAKRAGNDAALAAGWLARRLGLGRASRARSTTIAATALVARRARVRSACAPSPAA